MVSHRQRVVRGTVSSDHIVQLFDAPESLRETVGAFLYEGLQNGASLLVVAKPASVQGIGEAFVERGLSMPALIAEGRLTVLDAQLTLRSFMRNGVPDMRLFAANVCEVVGRLCAESENNLRIYGEMVEILAEEANFRGAEALEDLWNELGARESFTLLCGYSSAHFAAPNAGSALEQICRKHTRVHQDNADLLGNWLLSSGRQLA